MTIPVCMPGLRNAEHLDYNPILIFKQQGHEQDNDTDDVLLGIQTEFQRDMMIKFGNMVICVDTSHCTNIYDFYLITVLVVDEYGEGIPVAWGLSNREETCALVQLFKHLKKRTGSLQPRVFMSDDAEQFWNSWVGVYGSNETKKILCAWHVDRAWRKALNEHIKDKEERIVIYHYLQVMLAQQNEGEFQITLQQFLSYVRHKHYNFYTYFSTYYSNRVQEWATCHRKWQIINTNMYVEAFHRLLKKVYLEGKQNTL